MTRTSLVLVCIAALPSVSMSQGIVLRRDTVIPVVIDDNLSARSSRPGDRFHAHVDDNRDLPFDTRLEGRIVAIRDKRGDQPAAMELVFTALTLPDGSRTPIDALPISMNDRTVSRDRDGRFTAKQDNRKKGSAVLGGAIGGFILGSIFQKQVEGTILGTVVGIVVAESDRSNDGDTVLTKGSRIGALFTQDANIDMREARRDTPRRTNDDGWRRDDERGLPPTNPGRQTDRVPEVDRRDTVVQLGGKDLKWDKDRPYFQGDTLMVPLKQTVDQLDLKTSDDYNRESQMLFIDGPLGYVRLRIDSTEARLNGHTIDLAVAPCVRDGVTYVPLEIMAQVAKELPTVNGQKIARRNDQ